MLRDLIALMQCSFTRPVSSDMPRSMLYCPCGSTASERAAPQARVRGSRAGISKLPNGYRKELADPGPTPTHQPGSARLPARDVNGDIRVIVFDLRDPRLTVTPMAHAASIMLLLAS